METNATLTDAQRQTLDRARRMILAGHNECETGGGYGFWFYGSTLSYGALSWCCKNAHAQTVARCRGDAANAMERVFLAAQAREMGSECAVV